MNPLWAALWAVWVGIFAVLEFVAVRNRAESGDTLSENIRWLFHAKTPGVGRWVWVLASGFFFAWFVPHIMGVHF